MPKVLAPALWLDTRRLSYVMVDCVRVDVASPVTRITADREFATLQRVLVSASSLHCEQHVDL